MSPEYPQAAPIFSLRYLKPPKSLSPQAKGEDKDKKAFPIPDKLKSKLIDDNALKFAQQSPLPYDNNLKNMEIEVNAHYDELVDVTGDTDHLLLSAQIKRLQVCLDIYIETERSGELHDKGGKLCLRQVRGRDRRKPFVFDEELGLFDQRK